MEKTYGFKKPGARSQNPTPGSCILDSSYPAAYRGVVYFKILIV
jgi:hypothetical protein